MAHRSAKSELPLHRTVVIGARSVITVPGPLRTATGMLAKDVEAYPRYVYQDAIDPVLEGEAELYNCEAMVGMTEQTPCVR